MDIAILDAGTMVSMQMLAIVVGSLFASTGLFVTSSQRVAEALKKKLNSSNQAEHEEAAQIIGDHDIAQHYERFGPALEKIKEVRIPLDTRVFDGALSHSYDPISTWVINPLALEHINSWGFYFQHYSSLRDLRAALSAFYYYISSEEIMKVLRVFYPSRDRVTGGRGSPVTTEGLI